jgi:hypothetical protein
VNLIQVQEVVVLVLEDLAVTIKVEMAVQE